MKAANGIEALQKAAETTPDVVLLDVKMPGMDGFEVCRRLRDDPHLREVPIIILTGLTDRDSKIKGIESGADDFLTKPFDQVELEARVASITRLNRYRKLLLERSRFEWVVQHSQDGYVMISNGMNLTPEHLSRAWTPYFQGEKDPTGEMLGMGLGLSTVAQLVWGTGGRCRASATGMEGWESL